MSDNKEIKDVAGLTALAGTGIGAGAAVAAAAGAAVLVPAAIGGAVVLGAYALLKGIKDE